MADRIAALQKLLARDDRDVFAHYSLGMEFFSAGRHEEAVAEFHRCMELDERYVSAYVEAGKCLRAAGRMEESRAMLNRALELAGQLGQGHTQDYIRGQLEGLG